MVSDLHRLTGRTISAAHWDGESVYLTIDGGKVLRLTPWGDCCSHCFVQHISGADALVGGAVASVEDIVSEPTDEEKAQHEVLDGWGHRITTNKGVCSIEMRLSHNGYYGGSLDAHGIESVPTTARPLEDF